MIIADVVRWLSRHLHRSAAQPQLPDPRPVDVWHDKLFDGDAQACEYFRRTGRWS